MTKKIYTEKEQKVLFLFHDLLEKNKDSSIAAISKKLKRDTTTIGKHLLSLFKKGYISRVGKGVYSAKKK